MNFYRPTLCSRHICCRFVSICLSHTSMYRNGCTDQADFFHTSFHPLCFRDIVISPKTKSTSLWNFVETMDLKCWQQHVQRCQERYKQATFVGLSLITLGVDSGPGQVLSTSINQSSTDDYRLLFTHGFQLCLPHVGSLGVRQCRAVSPR